MKSRFGWGLTVAIEAPELETRVAILMSKAEHSGIDLPNEVAFFIAKRIRSNIRELEGALRRVAANSQFTGKPITLDFAKEALRDLLALQDKLVTIDNIQKTVAEYYKIRVADILSKFITRGILGLVAGTSIAEMAGFEDAIVLLSGGIAAVLLYIIEYLRQEAVQKYKVMK